jgi:hypothetical protein
MGMSAVSLVFVLIKKVSARLHRSHRHDSLYGSGFTVGSLSHSAGIRWIRLKRFYQSGDPTN